MRCSIRKIFLVLVVIGVIGMGETNGQNAADTDIPDNAVYVELFGSAGYLYNVSYDRRLYSRGQNHVSAALGVQIQDPVELDAQNSISPQVNYLRGSRHMLEVGLGYIYQFKRMGKMSRRDHVVLRLGYRYQKRKRVFFKVALTPFFQKGDPGLFGIGLFGGRYAVFPWGGVAVGYAF